MSGAMRGAYLPWSPRQLEWFRKEAAEYMTEHGWFTETEPARFTCDDCPLKHSCTSVFDPYNTDGDCLEEK